MTQEELNGYKACMKDFEKYLHESILRNKGVTTGEQAFQVVSDLALWTHTQDARIKQMQAPQKELYAFYIG